jgi:hypothetical protein
LAAMSAVETRRITKRKRIGNGETNYEPRKAPIREGDANASRCEIY